MGRNRLTREEIISLRLMKKRKLRRYTCYAISAVVLIELTALFIYRNLTHKDGEGLRGGEITTGIRADIGALYDFSEISVGTATNASSNNDTDAETDSKMNSEADSETNSKIDSDFVFEVPATSLPDVESIEGDNWYDDSFYEKADADPVAMSYFNDTVFIGDSRTEGLLIYSGVPNLNGFCYKGLSVDKLDSDESIMLPGSDELYTCYDAISRTEFDNYYCMFGVNELGWVSPSVFVDEFSALVDHIFSVNPDAVVYVESILPVTEQSSSESDIYTQERIDEYNELLLSMCKERKDVIYLDLAAAVSDDSGYLPDEASADGIHCSSDYCKRMIQYIRCNTFRRK